MRNEKQTKLSSDRTPTPPPRPFQNGRSHRSYFAGFAPGLSVCDQSVHHLGPLRTALGVQSHRRGAPPHVPWNPVGSRPTPSISTGRRGRLAHEAGDAGWPSPDLAAGISRVKGAKQLGQRSKTGPEQSSEAAQPRSRRPDARKTRLCMLALLFGCGLRRSELVGLDMSDVEKRQEHRAIVDLIGKGGHICTVRDPEWAKPALDEWTVAAGIRDGKSFEE